MEQRKLYCSTFVDVVVYWLVWMKSFHPFSSGDFQLGGRVCSVCDMKGGYTFTSYPAE